MTTSGADATEHLVLDTSAYSHLRRGREDVVDAVARATPTLVSTIVLGELEAGFSLGRRAERNRSELADFLEEPAVLVIPVTAAVARRYGEVFRQLRLAGRPIPTNDMWIAATALVHEGRVLTTDPHFQEVEGLHYALLSS